jgi:uncharacterized membrane protein YeaQ/YmgE (transglycosylase-associated protein family)
MVDPDTARAYGPKVSGFTPAWRTGSGRLLSIGSEEAVVIGAILLGLVAGIVGRLLVPDMWSRLSGPKSWLFSLLLGLAGALLGYVVFTVGLGIGDEDVFDFGGIIGAIIGVIILLPFVGIFTRFFGARRT